jgi:hypothetical protein
MRTLHSADRSISAQGAGNAGVALSRCDRTGVSIPECGCRSCGERQIAQYAPWLANRRQGANGR